MSELEQKMRVKAIMHNTIESFRVQNGIQAAMIIDALTAEIANLYPIMQQEYFAQIDAEKAQQQASEKEEGTE